MRRIARVSEQLVSSLRCAPKRKPAPSALFDTDYRRCAVSNTRHSRALHTSVPKCLEAVSSTAGEDSIAHRPEPLALTNKRIKDVPLICPGCGALGQTVESDEPGYYNTKAKRNARKKEDVDEDTIFQQAMSRLAAVDGETVSPVPEAHIKNAPSASVEEPICDRCHYLIYQSHGVSIAHPSMESIQSIIEASPYKHNHIYHVLDAADFPMSLIPNLMHALQLPRLRTQNRRSKTLSWARGRRAEVSFIITRADLLAPRKEQVDRMMPYLQAVLRDALGRSAVNVRLGNVRCVSAMRGWWTPAVKQDIWDRGGAGWFVGKANVGKSALFEVVFPKGKGVPEPLKLSPPPSRTPRFDDDDLQQQLAQQLEGHSETDLVDAAPQGSEQEEASVSASVDDSQTPENADLDPDTGKDVFFDESVDASLLPPARAETPFPQMPIVSSLPGTTASPIRIPYGGGRGELIDLPGVERSLLEQHVQPEHRASLVMSRRVAPEQQAINAGQSLLLGGLIRITPTSDDVQVLAYAFTPLAPHVTQSGKAIAIQTGRHEEDGAAYAGTVPSIATDAAKQDMRSAGRFALRWDVTRQRTGALTHKAAGKQKPDNLPFIVYGADILVEGVGWVELTCQVRRYPRRQPEPRKDDDEVPSWDHDDEWPKLEEKGEDAAADTEPTDSAFPTVEVFAPEGKFIGIRRPMNAWELAGPKKAGSRDKSRPRYTISMKRRQAGGAQGGQARG